MSFKPPSPLASRRFADGCRWEISRVAGQWSVTVIVATTGEPVVQRLTQAEIVAVTTGTERTNTQSLLDKIQDAALVKTGWVLDGDPEA